MLESDLSAPTPLAPLSRHRSTSIILLTLWLLDFLPVLLFLHFDRLNFLNLDVLFGLAYVASPAILIALWFSLQYDILIYYLPTIPRDEWTSRTFLGTFLGTILGMLIGVLSLAIGISIALKSFEMSSPLPLPIAAILGAASGFAVLGSHQAHVLRPFLPRVRLWIAIMSLAWFPIFLIFVAFNPAIMASMNPADFNVYTIAKYMTLQSALLMPLISAFLLLCHFSISPPASRPPFPRIILVLLLIPLLLILLNLGALVFAPTPR